MSKDQPRLGRGLSSLISSTVEASAVDVPRRPSTQAAAVTSQNIGEVEVAMIDANPMQPRRVFDQGRLQSLADSLRRNGTLQPVVVRRRNERFELVAGERRWRAAQAAGLPTIPAIIRDADDEMLLELALVENIQREDLNAIDRARAYVQLASRFGLSHDEIGRRMGEDRSTVANYVRLLDLGDDVLRMVADGRLSMGHARCLLGLSSPNEQAALSRRIAAEAWSVRQTEQHVTKLRQNLSSSKPRAAPRAVISDLEDRISRALGLRVRILESRRRNSGRVVIDYHSLDDFERLTGRLGVAGD